MHALRPPVPQDHQSMLRFKFQTSVFYYQMFIHFSKPIHMCIFFLTSVRGWENVFLIVIWPMSKHSVMGFWRPQRTDVAITDVSRKRGEKTTLWFIHIMEWERNEFTETKLTQRIVVKFTAKETFALDDRYLQFISLCSRKNNWLPKMWNV